MKRLRRRPLVLGHRGYRARFPENTLLAFREAMAAGAQGVECDLQKTRDGRYVVIHDPSTGRVSGADRAVASSRLEELLALDFGGGEKIATLEELCELLRPDGWLDLELKEETIRPEDCPAIASALSGIPPHRLMISSFDAGLLVPFRETGITVGFLVGEEAASRGLLGFMRLLRLVRPAYVNLPIDMLRRVGIRRATVLTRLLRLAGFRILFWTVNEAEEMAFASAHGDVIVTDEVEKVVDFLDKRKTTVS